MSKQSASNQQAISKRSASDQQNPSGLGGEYNEGILDLQSFPVTIFRIGIQGLLVQWVSHFLI